MIDSKTIKKLAALARVHIPEAEEESLAKEVESILAYVEQIQSASGEVDRKIPEHRNIMREDAAPHESGIHTENLLNNAPERRGNYLKVKKILS
jgi:aspartyl-tRNA(Asn)/glutamyl-tRNA(Gln) amidotransferase subunit C